MPHQAYLGVARGVMLHLPRHLFLFRCALCNDIHRGMAYLSLSRENAHAKRYAPDREIAEEGAAWAVVNVDVGQRRL